MILVPGGSAIPSRSMKLRVWLHISQSTFSALLACMSAMNSLTVAADVGECAITGQLINSYVPIRMLVCVFFLSEVAKTTSFDFDFFSFKEPLNSYPNSFVHSQPVEYISTFLKSLISSTL